MRVYGRIYDEEGNYTWQVVETDASGYNDAVHLTALVQVLQLQTGESPFYAKSGIPAEQSVQTQVAPDYYVMRIQQQYSGFFASLIITKQQPFNTPNYSIQAISQRGSILQDEIAI
jgi:hypothetical protein